MARLMAIDYGRRRCGVAVTDVLQLAGTALATVPTGELLAFVTSYVAREPVETIVVGLPTQMNGRPSESMRFIQPFVAQLRKALPEGIGVEMYDERFTSTIAHRAMIDGGMKKHDRRDKARVDTIAATIILNDYIQSREMRGMSGGSFTDKK